MAQPLSEQLEALYRKLGAEIRPPDGSGQDFIKYVYFHNCRGHDSWTGTDPRGELQDVSDTVLHVDAVGWPAGALFLDGYEDWTRVDMCGASENYEVFEGDVTYARAQPVPDTRRLLYQIAYDDSQYVYALDLLDKSADPPVYRFDHEDPRDYYQLFPRLSLFLASLKTEAVAAASKRSEEWEALINAALAARKGTQAVELATEALAEHPANTDFLRIVATYRAIQGDDRKAEELYRLALEMDEDHVDALAGLGIMLIRRGELAGGDALLQRLVARDASFAPGHYVIARGFALSGRKDEMITALNRAIELDPANRAKLGNDADFAAFQDDPDFVALSKAEREPASG